MNVKVRKRKRKEEKNLGVKRKVIQAGMVKRKRNYLNIDWWQRGAGTLGAST